MLIRQVRLQAPDGNSTQDYTVSGFGTPDWCMVLWGGVTESSWSASADTVGVGFFDGTTQHCAGHAGDHGDGVNSNSIRSRASNNEVIAIQWDSIADRRTASAEFIPDGVRLTWSGGSTGFRPYVTVILGRGGTAEVGFHTASGVDTGTSTESGLSITPKLLICASIQQNAADDVTGPDYRYSVGFATDNGTSIDQVFKAMRANDNDPMDFNAHVGNTGAVAIECGIAGNPTYAEITSIQAGGFSTETHGTANFGTGFIFMALTFDEDVHVFSSATPTTTGDYTPFNAGFQPQWAFMVPTAGDQLNVDEGTGQSMVEEWGHYSVIDQTEANDESGHYAVYEDGTASPSTLIWRGRADTDLQINTVSSSAPTNLVLGSQPSFTATGITYADANFSEDGTARYIIGFAIEEETGLIQKSSSDGSSLQIDTAELPIGDRRSETYDQGIVDAFETASSDQFITILGTTDTGNLSSVESQSLEQTGGLVKSGTDDVTDLSVTESRILEQFDQSTTLESTDYLDLSDLRNENFIPNSANLTAFGWTQTNITPVFGGVITSDGGAGYTLDRDNVSAASGSLSITSLDMRQLEVLHTISVRIKHPTSDPLTNDFSRQSWVWMDLPDLGLNLLSWFRFDLSLEYWTVGTTRGSDVIDIGVVPEPPSNSFGALGWHRLYISFRTVADLSTDFYLGLSDADGSKAIGTYAGVRTLLFGGAHLKEGTIGDYDTEGEYWPNFSATIVSERTYDIGSVQKINDFKTAYDSGGISVLESTNLDISGTITRSRTDSGDLDSAEIGYRSKDVYSADSNGLLDSVESTELYDVPYDPSWEDDDVPWGGLLLGAKDLAPIYTVAADFFALGLAPDKPLECFIERRAVVFDKGLALLGRYVYPQIIGPASGSVWISLGGHNTPDGQVDWEGPYEFKIGEDISVDFAVAGRYLAIRFESDETSVWDLQSFDVDYEVVGVY